MAIESATNDSPAATGRPKPNRIASLASMNNLSLKEIPGLQYKSTSNHDAHINYVDNNTYAITSGSASSQTVPPPATATATDLPIPTDEAAIENLNAYLSTLGLDTTHLLNNLSRLTSSANAPRAIVDSGIEHTFNHKNCQLSPNDNTKRIVATLFHISPRSITPEASTEASISQAALFDFISTWDNLLVPWRKWDSSHRCLDNPDSPRIVELLLPSPSPEHLTLTDLQRHEEIAAFEQRWNIEVILQPNNVFRKHKRLIVFDMDSTLIQQEVIDEIAKFVGKSEEVAAITARAMNGELDFEASLRARVALLKGVPATVFESLKPVITFTPGARELCKALKKLGFKLAVLSGGFIPLAEYVRQELGLDYAYANSLVSDASGESLTGELSGSIIHAEAKQSLLQTIADKEGIALEQTLAVGDGANDLKMMGVAGLGVAFNAKPKVQELAPCRLNTGSLKDILYILGLTKGEQEDLLAL